MQFIKENFDIPVDKVEKEKFLECYLPTLDKIIEIFPVGEFEDKKLASMDVQALIKNQLEDLFDNGYVEEEDVKPCIDLQRLIDRIKEDPSNFDDKIVKCVVVVEPEVEEVTESLNEAKSNGEELNQFFIFEDAAYCFGLQNPEDSFEKFINQFENIEFEGDEIKTLKEKFAAGVEKSKETNKEVDEEIDETVVKEIVESLSSKEAAAADLREKYKDPKYKEIIDALIEIFKEHAPEQAEGIEKALEEKEEINESNNILTEDLKKSTPYMLRNDGELLDVTPIHPYIKYGHESVETALDKLATTRFSSLEWFYENTKSEDTRQLIRVIAKYLLVKGKVESIDFCDLTEDIPTIDSREVDGYLQELNDNTNQEFCRVRTSGLIFGGSSNEIYFRISSIGFNWFDLIWELVYKYKTSISDITICKDSNTFGGKFDPYRINGQPVNHLPVSEFLNCPGNPIVKSVPSKTEAINEATKALSVGKLISEAYDKQLHPIHVHSFYETQVAEKLNEELDHLLVKNNSQSLIEALHGVNEVEQFVKMAKAIGLKTMGDVKKFLDYEGEGKDILTALYDYLHDEIGDLNFQAKDESLKESIEETKEEVEEIPAPPADPETSYIANALNDLISGELNTIKQYNDFLLSLDADDIKEKVDDSVKTVISDIVNEENLHIGQLQEVLKKFSPNAESIEDGKEEAKEQLEETTEEKE